MTYQYVIGVSGLLAMLFGLLAITEQCHARSRLGARCHRNLWHSGAHRAGAITWNGRSS